MASLIYSALMSLDGYVADASGNFDWAVPDEEVFLAVNDLERRIGTNLLGRRMYEVMKAWDDPTVADGGPAHEAEFATNWRRADKIVYSKSLASVSSLKARLEREFDLDAVRRLKGGAERDLAIGGPELAGRAIEAGLVDEYHFFVSPVIVGGGKSAFPAGLRIDLQLVDDRRFGNGVVQLQYRPK